MIKLLYQKNTKNLMITAYPKSLCSYLIIQMITAFHSISLELFTDGVNNYSKNKEDCFIFNLFHV